MKFKVGDRVRLINNDYYDNLTIGALGTVEGLEDEGLPWPVLVEFDDRSYVHPCSNKELEKV